MLHLKFATYLKLMTPYLSLFAQEAAAEIFGGM